MVCEEALVGLTYHAFGEDDAHFLNSSCELLLGDAPFVLDVEKFERLLEECRLVLGRRALLGQFSLQVLLKSVSRAPAELDGDRAGANGPFSGERLTL